MAQIGITKYTSQNIDNMSFDDELKVKMVELIGADGVLKNPATEEKQDAIIGNYATKIVISGTDIYVGKAAIGSAVGSAVWQIKRIDTASDIVITWADGNATFDNVMSNAASLSYS